MKNNDFYYVKEVAKEQSFSLAAKKIGISQPELSSYISKLEKRVGVMLFDRSISPIELTEYGKYYLEYADAVLNAEETFENIVSDLSDVRKGLLSIGSTACFAIELFHAKYEGINFSIMEGKVPEMLERCFEGDVGMVMSDSSIVSSLFDKEILFEERILMSVPRQSPINEKVGQYAIPTEDIIHGNLNSEKFKDVDISLFKDEKFLLLNDDQPIRKIVDKLFSSAGIQPKLMMEVPQTTTGLSMTIAGLGISFVAESTIKYGNLKDHPVYYRVGTRETMSREMCVAYKKNKYITKAGRLFIEELKQLFNAQ